MFIVGNTDMLHTHTLWKSIIDELSTDQSIGDSMPLIDTENDSIFQVRSADEISVLLGDKLHDTGGEGMITYEEYKAQQVNKKKGKGKGKGKGKAREGPVADRWSELGKDSQGGGKRGEGKGTRNSGYEDHGEDAFPRIGSGHAAEKAAAPRPSPPPSMMEADGHECELVTGKGDQDDDMGKKGAKKKPKQQKQKQVLLVRG